MKRYILLLSSLAILTLLNITPANAASSFEAGRIIDDAVFTNKSTMSVADIQTFLNSKVPSCDTNGAQQSEMNNAGVPDENGNGSIQRWEWAKHNYGQTTFPCLRNYTQDGMSAAQLIYNASQTYSINPQVMIVLLQKEQGLITDTWPLNVQYRSATGYGCPDTAACDSQYYGLKNQLNWAATMFRAIMNNSPTWYTPYELGDNYIRYNPNASCGGSTVNIQNRSTQALYNYTPYQPNSKVLDWKFNGGPSVGSGYPDCGAFGNINFFTYFTDWFGESYQPFTSMVAPRWMQTAPDTTYIYNVFTGEQVDDPLAKGVQILGASKITVNSITYIRTHSDTNNNLPQGIKLSDLQDVSYEPMSHPRWMKMNRNGYKQIPRTGYNTDRLMEKDRAIHFNQKITINNTVYLRTSHDSAIGNDKAIPLIFLDDTSFDPLMIPRWMNVDKLTQTIDPNNGHPIDSVPAGTQILFTSKLQLNDKIYLRSKEDTDTNTQASIDMNDTSENSFQSMIIPRVMKVNTPTTKFDTRTATSVNSHLTQGQEIRFKSKIYVNGIWYLRSEVDTNSHVQYGVPISNLDEPQ